MTGYYNIDLGMKHLPHALFRHTSEEQLVCHFVKYTFWIPTTAKGAVEEESYCMVDSYT